MMTKMKVKMKMKNAEKIIYPKMVLQLITLLKKEKLCVVKGFFQIILHLAYNTVKFIN